MIDDLSPPLSAPVGKIGGPDISSGNSTQGLRRVSKQVYFFHSNIWNAFFSSLVQTRHTYPFAQFSVNFFGVRPIRQSLKSTKM